MYISVSLVAPLGPNRFNLTPAKTYFIQLTILLPVVLIWALAVFGAERFKNYTHSISNDKDGQALNKMANGLIFLVAAIIISGLFSILRRWAIIDGWLSPYTITSNLISAFLPLIAFGILYSGSRDLVKLTKVRKNERWGQRIAVLVFLAIITILYIHSLLNYKYRLSTPDPSNYSSFYMSDVLILFTQALPYILGWWFALTAAFNLNTYRQRVQGKIYKSALFRLVIGIFMVTVFYMVVQMLVAFSTYFASAKLSSILFIIFLLLILYGAGFVFIASGAKKLNSIEKAR